MSSHLAGLEPATFRLTAERANRLRHKCLPVYENDFTQLFTPTHSAVQRMSVQRKCRILWNIVLRGRAAVADSHTHTHARTRTYTHTHTHTHTHTRTHTHTNTHSHTHTHTHTYTHTHAHTRTHAHTHTHTQMAVKYQLIVYVHFHNRSCNAAILACLPPDLRSVMHVTSLCVKC